MSETRNHGPIPVGAQEGHWADTETSGSALFPMGYGGSWGETGGDDRLDDSDLSLDDPVHGQCNDLIRGFGFTAFTIGYPNGD